MILVFDLEWLPEDEEDIVHSASKIHCAVFKELGTQNIWEFTDRYDDGNFYTKKNDSIHGLLSQATALIGHNIVQADLHVLRKLLGIEFTVSPQMTLMGKECKFIDTYSMSMRLFPDRPTVMHQGKSLGVHGLKAWAKRTGMYKPEIQDWKGLSTEEYLHRCREDVLNNEATYYMLLEEMRR